MRWKGVIAFVILVAAGAAIFMFFLDRWMEAGLERAGEALAGARVEIDGFDFSLTGLSVSWDRLRVADADRPMRNLIETERAAFDLDARALMRKRFIVEEMTLAGVRSGSERDTDGSLPKRKRKARPEGTDILSRTQARLTEQVANLPVMAWNLESLRRKVNVDSLMERADLRTPARLDSAKQEAMRTSEKWREVLRDFRVEEEIGALGTEIDAIDVKRLNTAAEVLDAAQRLKSLQERIEALSGKLSATAGEARADWARFDDFPRRAEGWIAEDYRRLLAMARLPDLSAGGIGKALLGPALLSKLYRYLEIAKRIRDAVPERSVRPKKAKPKRLQGQTIRYADRHGWPGFLIRRMHLSGRTGPPAGGEGLDLSGTAEGVTSQPRVYGRPTRIDLRGEAGDGWSAAFFARLDRTTEALSDSFRVRLRDIPLGGVALAGAPYLPERLDSGSANLDLTLRLEENRVRIGADLRARALEYAFASEPEGTFARVVRDVLGSLETVRARIEVTGTGEETRFSVDSNLDEAVSRELRSLASRALAETEERVRGRLRTLAGGRLSAIGESVDAGKTGSLALLENSAALTGGLEERITDLMKQIATREAEGLGNRAKNLLEGLIKKQS